MGKRLEAVYENGVLRLLEPVDLKEHQRVTVTIDENGARAADEATRGQQESPMPTSGAELVAYWEKKGVIGTRPNITDSVAHARALRHQAEIRQR
jgi:predicted DNA-binding antitoxin AbrB/MazE fold protein